VNSVAHALEISLEDPPVENEAWCLEILELHVVLLDRSAKSPRHSGSIQRTIQCRDTRRQNRIQLSDLCLEVLHRRVERFFLKLCRRRSDVSDFARDTVYTLLNRRLESVLVVRVGLSLILPAAHFLENVLDIAIER